MTGSGPVGVGGRKEKTATLVIWKKKEATVPEGKYHGRAGPRVYPKGGLAELSYFALEEEPSSPGWCRELPLPPGGGVKECPTRKKEGPSTFPMQLLEPGRGRHSRRGFVKQEILTRVAPRGGNIQSIPLGEKEKDEPDRKKEGASSKVYPTAWPTAPEVLPWPIRRDAANSP